MSAITVMPPFPIFNDTNGVPLQSGYVYVGVSGMNAEANPIPVFWDSALTIPAAQPLRTSGGYVSRNGSPAQVYADAVDFSLLVKNKSLAIVWSSLKASGISPNASGIEYLPAGTGAVPTTVQSKLRETVSVKDFGAVGDGVNDDTLAIQKAINSGAKKIVIPYGVAGTYKITDAIQINSGGITVEFEARGIVLKKFYGSATVGLGNALVINAAWVTLINPGIDGNGATYGGGGILINDAPTYFTYDIRIENPYIFNTKDSCIILKGVQAGAGLTVTGGTLTTYNASGVSSNGYPAIRKIGAADTDASPRTITDVNTSSSPLIDLTGMVTTFVKGGQCATILFGGNPDVTGATFTSAKGSIVGVRIRDGLAIRGEDHAFSANITHGFAPQYTSYGVLGSPLSVGWSFETDARNCAADQSNIVINKYRDVAGFLGDACNKWFGSNQGYVPQWVGSVTNPSIGNGSITGTYNMRGNVVEVQIFISMGSTTTYGSGSYTFSLPFQISAGRRLGQVRVFNQGVNGAEWGMCIENTRGLPSRIEVAAANGVSFSPTVPHTFKANDTIEINYTYLRG